MTVRPTESTDLRLGALLSDFRLLLILFIAFRLMLVIVYQPVLLETAERGITAGGDFLYYFQLGALSDDGLLPFRDWWSEFPPIPSFLITVVYSLQSTSDGGNYTGFAMFLGLIMLLFDLGNLILVRLIGARVHGAATGIALAWVYALLLAPTIFIWWNFEPMVAFFLLLGLWWLLRDRAIPSALAACVGALIKFTPALILGAVWRFREHNAALRYTVISLGGVALVYALLFAGNSAMTLPSLTAQFNKASYQTVWALIDGNYRTGNFGPAVERLDPANAYVLTGNPSTVPGIVRLALAGAIGLFIFWRTRRFDDRGLVAFVTITLLIFFLQAQGWSPQWLAQIIPLVLLSFPTRNGIIAIVLLMLVTFAEYPFLFIRTGDTGGEITGALIMPFTILVVTRTLLLVGVTIALYARLRQEPVPRQAAPASAAAAAD
ncbi:MAG: DUF2029 domain-containing protein [Chloroflexi bacterium]|nr:DUF2029 domain-containing protein [Chloroflexota bacterium]